jgi:superfamily II DNA or RNA helicase
MTLRRWQSEALHAVAKVWQTSDRALVVAATGTGKSRFFSEVARRCKDKGRGRVLVLCPLIDLVDQAAESLRRAGLTAEVEQGDRMASIFPSLFGGSDVVVACSDSMTGRRLERWPPETFGRVVVDEAHCATGAASRAILARFSGAKVLAVTATPDELTLGVYGHPVYEYGIDRAIADGVLCPVVSRYLPLDRVSINSLKVNGKDLDADELARVLGPTRETIAAQCAVVAKEAGDRQTIVFLPNVDSAHAYRHEMGGIVGRDAVDSMDASTPPEARARVFRRFKNGEIRFLFNCALLTMGIDLPMASCVAMLRPTKSATLFRQCVGRGLRTHPGKADCLVLTIAMDVPNLCSSADLFADLPPDLRDAASRALMSGEDAFRVTSQAKERAQRRRAQQERERSEKLRIEVEYQAVVTDLFAQAGAAVDPSLAGGPRITEAQAEYLRKQYGTKHSLRKLSQKQYQALAAPLKERQRLGLCSLAQSRLLKRNGLPGDIPYADARLALDALAKEQKWRTG